MTAPSDRVAIIGAGTTPLISELVADGYSAITAVDISRCALDRLRRNLGQNAPTVRLICGDARHLRLPTTVDMWHDRATFHFLTDAADQATYAAAAADGVRRGGHLVLAQFAADGPSSCSGLPVARHSESSLASAFSDAFDLVESFERDHATPSGSTQRFVHAVLIRRERP